MIQIALTLSLFALYAGTRLLIRCKLDAPGKFFRFVSWFIIVMSFAMIAYSACTLTIRCCLRAHQFEGWKPGYSRNETCHREHCARFGPCEDDRGETECCRQACCGGHKEHGCMGSGEQMRHMGGMDSHEKNMCCHADSMKAEN